MCVCVSVCMCMYVFVYVCSVFTVKRETERVQISKYCYIL